MGQMEVIQEKGTTAYQRVVRYFEGEKKTRRLSLKAIYIYIFQNHAQSMLETNPPSCTITPNAHAHCTR